MSLVTCPPAKVELAVWRILPPRKTATLVEPPPSSIRAHPSSRSSGVSTASEAAKRLEHELRHLITRTLHAPPEVLDRAGEDRHQVYLGLQPGAGHPDRLGDALLLVDQVVLGNGMEQLVVPAEAHVARDIIDPRHVAGADLAAGDRDHPVGAPGRDVLSRDAAEDRADLHARHRLGVLHRLGDGAGHFVEVADHPSAEAAGSLGGDPQHPGAGRPKLSLRLGDRPGNPGRPEVEGRHQAFRLFAHAVPDFRTTTRGR